MITYLRILAICVPLCPTFAFAEDRPTTGIVYNTKEASALYYSCEPEQNYLKCVFTQTSVRKPNRKLSEEEIEKEAKEIYKSQTNIIAEKKICKFFSDISDVITGKSSIEDKAGELIASGQIADKEVFFDSIQNMSELQKNEMVSMGEAIGRVCKDNSIDNIKNVVRIKNENELNYCSVSSGTFHQTLKHVYDYTSGASSWVVAGEPQGPCGTVQLSRFEKSEGFSGITFWNYISEKKITNKKGLLYGTMSCADLDEQAYLYSWKSEDHYMGCTKITFGAF